MSATTGKVMLMDKDPAEFSFDEYGPLIGVGNHDEHFWPLMTVYENLEFIAICKGLDIGSQEFDNTKRMIIETLQLSEYTLTYARDLSGGNKRKLVCAMALIVCPSMLFLDEPTIGMDASSRIRLYEFLHKLKDTSILMTSSRTEEIEIMCSKVGVMINGMLVEFENVKELKDRVRGGYTIVFKQSVIQCTDV